MRIDIKNRDIDNNKIKYFLAYEGIKTEVLYFQGIIDNKEEIGIKENIEIIPLLRNHCFLGWSNPTKAYERTNFCINNLLENKRNISALMSSVVEFCFYKSPEFNNRGDASRLYDLLISFMSDKFNLNKHDNIKYDDLRMNYLISFISDYFKNNYNIKNVESFIKSQLVSFNPKKDKVCLIVDRDRKSVSEYQYQEFIKTCNLNNVKVYFSNPCFEFWLLLHFDEVFDIDKALIEDNRKMLDIVNPPHFCETELIKLLPGYEKNNICFNQLMKRIPKAIENEKRFSENLEDIKTCIGSNVGLLIKELLK